MILRDSLDSKCELEAKVEFELSLSQLLEQFL